MPRNRNLSALLGLFVFVGCFTQTVAQAQTWLKPDSYQWSRSDLTMRLERFSATVSPDDKKIVQLATQNLIYPMTDPEVQNIIDGKKKTIKQAGRIIFKHPMVYYTSDPINGAKVWIDKIYGDKTRNTGMQQEFDQTFFDAFARILNNEDQPAIAQINAALVMAHFAGKTGNAAIADLALKKLSAPMVLGADARKHDDDGLRLHLLRGLHNVLARRKSPVTDEQRERIAVAMMAFIKREQPKALALSERDNRLLFEGYRYLRREAVRVLAQIDFPSFKTKDRKVIRPAETLFEVVQRNKLDPVPRLDERAIAAMGLLRMQSKVDKLYNPDATAFYGGMLVFDLAKAHEFEAQQAARPRFPYKLYAVRLKETLDVLAKNNALKPGIRAGTYDESTMLGKFIATSKEVLNLIENDVGSPDVSALSRWLAAEDEKPQNKKLFRD